MGRLTACGRGRIRPTTSATGLGDLSAVTLATSTLMSISFGAIPKNGGRSRAAANLEDAHSQAAAKEIVSWAPYPHLSISTASARNGATHYLEETGIKRLLQICREIFARAVFPVWLTYICQEYFVAKASRPNWPGFAVCKNPQRPWLGTIV